jgi:hypothetical protein
MSLVVAEPDRVQVQYTGGFAEPAFAALGNPAPIYASLLREFQSFGADVKGLSIDLSVLSQANITCSFHGGLVRVWLERVEVFLSEVRSPADVQRAVTAAWTALGNVGDALRPVSHSAILVAWARLKDEKFSAYIRRFLNLPVSAGKPTLELTMPSPYGGTDSIQFAEAVPIPEGLFIRSTINLGSGSTNYDDLLQKFRNRFGAQVSDMQLSVAVTNQ